MIGFARIAVLARICLNRNNDGGFVKYKPH